MNTTSQSPVYTVGHSTHSQDHLISLLKRHGITALCDVRSRPYSRMNPQFNMPELTRALKKQSIRYVFLGKELGARSDDLSCYERGRVRYDLLARTPLFQSGLDRISAGMESFKLALMCAEKDHLYCHRTILVARHLEKREIRVEHILANGGLETNEEALLRLAQLLNVREEEKHMFRSREQLFDELYEIQEKRIAFEKDQSPNETLTKNEESQDEDFYDRFY
jgi:uncharacterized protein (DUF488 family)